MKSLLEVLNLATDFLAKKGIASPRRQAQDLFCDALGLSRTQLYMEHDRPVTEPELELLRLKLARRAKGEPNPYIHGKHNFYNCTFLITPDVLIPRQETEILVDKIAEEIEKSGSENKNLWDLCTGSGCIGIALKKKFPQLHVTLSDISEKAVALAKENSRLNEVEVEVLQGDLLKPFEGRKTHYFVCNPPYISEAEYLDLDKEVRDFEPKQALVGGETGLEFYRRLAADLNMYMHPEGKAWFEIGTKQGEDVKSLFRNPPWKQRGVEQDWAGHDRFFFLEIE